MARTVARLAALLAFLLPTPSLLRAADVPSREQAEFFEKKVRPVLVSKCQGCHGPEKQKVGLRLDSREALLEGGESGPVVEPGDPDASPLVQAVEYSGDSQIPMPPKGKLEDDEIKALRDWVEMGAPWPESKAAPKSEAPSQAASKPDPRSHSAFRPVVEPALPPVTDGRWPNSPIDHFVLARLEARGLKPVGRAEKRVLIRRASFDLTGLPPTTGEIEAFLADDSPEAFARVVDRPLASPRYGER